MNDDETTARTPKSQIVVDTTSHMLRDPPPMLRRCNSGSSNSGSSTSSSNDSNGSGNSSSNDDYYHYQESSSRTRVFTEYDPSLVTFPILPSSRSSPRKKKQSLSSSSTPRALLSFSSSATIDDIGDSAPPVRVLFGNATATTPITNRMVVAPPPKCHRKTQSLSPICCTLPKTSSSREGDGNTTTNTTIHHLRCSIPGAIKLVPRRRPRHKRSTSDPSA